MEKKEIIRCFYEEVVSKNLLEELPQYVAEECEVRVGEQNFPLGIEHQRRNDHDHH